MSNFRGTNCVICGTNLTSSGVHVCGHITTELSAFLLTLPHFIATPYKPYILKEMKWSDLALFFRSLAAVSLSWS